MHAKRLLYPAFVFCALTAAVLATARTAEARVHLHGHWVANVAGWGSSSYEFYDSKEIDRNTYEGRFVHSFIDQTGHENRLEGTYVLHDRLTGGHITFQFDDGTRLKDVAHRVGNEMLLHHRGSGQWVVYHHE